MLLNIGPEDEAEESDTGSEGVAESEPETETEEETPEVKLTIFNKFRSNLLHTKYILEKKEVL